MEVVNTIGPIKEPVVIVADLSCRSDRVLS